MRALRNRLTLLALTFATIATPAFAQIDLSGNWIARQHEDRQERQPGPDAVDFLGLTINEEARIRALTYDAAQLGLPERQCMYYTPIYINQGPQAIKFWTEIHPLTGQLVAWRISGVVDRSIVTIWMDGRPHPPATALHTLDGFTTGRWDGTTLVARTTHMKEGYARRNGVPTSDDATIDWFFSRHGDYLTVTTFLNDPIYFTESQVLSRSWQHDPAGNVLPVQRPCWITDVEAEAGKALGVPHYLPGTNPFVGEVNKRYNIPVEAVMGGAETMYPEYRKRLKDTYKAPERCTRYCDGQNVRPPRE